MEERNDDDNPILLDTLYNELDMPAVLVSQMVNAVIREEIIGSLIRAGILTSEQLSTTLERAERDVNEFCDNAERKLSEEHKLGQTAREILQKKRDTAVSITERLRKKFIVASSSTSQEE